VLGEADDGQRQVGQDAPAGAGVPVQDVDDRTRALGVDREAGRPQTRVRPVRVEIKRCVQGGQRGH
jgi:hypothetical protein